MDIKQVIMLSCTKDDKTFSFYMPNGATWGQAIDASYEVMQTIIKMSRENIEKLDPADQKTNIEG